MAVPDPDPPVPVAVPDPEPAVPVAVPEPEPEPPVAVPEPCEAAEPPAGTEEPVDTGIVAVEALPLASVNVTVVITGALPELYGPLGEPEAWDAGVVASEAGQTVV